jgi:hypothetical protein
MDARDFDPTLPVLDVIAKLLLVALPAELRASTLTLPRMSPNTLT